ARHCERSEAIHGTTSGKMDCFVASLLAMTTQNKNGRDRSRPFRILPVAYRGGAMPGGGGGSEVLLPVSSGVMRRTVTRRLMRLGPGVCSFRYCEPETCPGSV